MTQLVFTTTHTYDNMIMKTVLTLKNKTSMFTIEPRELGMNWWQGQMGLDIDWYQKGSGVGFEMYSAIWCNMSFKEKIRQIYVDLKKEKKENVSVYRLVLGCLRADYVV